MGKSAPSPPDPVATANAQAAANKEAVRESALVNQINQISPWGQVGFTGGIGEPDRTQTTTLDPLDQYILDQQRAIGVNLLGMGQNQLIPAVSQALGQPLDFSQLPQIRGGAPALMPRLLGARLGQAQTQGTSRWPFRGSPPQDSRATSATSPVSASGPRLARLFRNGSILPTGPRQAPVVRQHPLRQHPWLRQNEIPR